MGTCPVGNVLALPRRSLGAFGSGGVPGAAGQDEPALPDAVPCGAGLELPRRGRERRALLTEGLWQRVGLGVRAGLCLMPRGWAGHRRLCRGCAAGVPLAPLVLPAPRGYMGYGGAGLGSTLPVLCSTRTGPLSFCTAGFGSTTGFRHQHNLVLTQ